MKRFLVVVSIVGVPGCENFVRIDMLRLWQFCRKGREAPRWPGRIRGIQSTSNPLNAAYPPPGSLETFSPR